MKKRSAVFYLALIVLAVVLIYIIVGPARYFLAPGSEIDAVCPTMSDSYCNTEPSEGSAQVDMDSWETSFKDKLKLAALRARSDCLKQLDACVNDQNSELTKNARNCQQASCSFNFLESSVDFNYACGITHCSGPKEGDDTQRCIYLPHQLEYDDAGNILGPLPGAEPVCDPIGQIGDVAVRSIKLSCYVDSQLYNIGSYTCQRSSSGGQGGTTPGGQTAGGTTPRQPSGGTTPGSSGQGGTTPAGQ